MIKHIVMIKLRDFETEKLKKEKASQFKIMLEQLVDQVPELKSMEVGLNFSAKPSAYDIVLTSMFEDEKALENYRIHPEHVKVLDFLKQIMEKTAVVDYDMA